MRCFESAFVLLKSDARSTISVNGNVRILLIYYLSKKTSKVSTEKKYLKNSSAISRRQINTLLGKYLLRLPHTTANSTALLIIIGSKTSPHSNGIIAKPEAKPANQKLSYLKIVSQYVLSAPHPKPKHSKYNHHNVKLNPTSNHNANNIAIDTPISRVLLSLMPSYQEPFLSLPPKRPNTPEMVLSIVIAQILYKTSIF